MNIYTYANREIDEIKDEMKRALDLTWYEENRLNFSSTPWQEYKPGKLGPDKEWLQTHAENVQNMFFEYVDCLAFVVPEEEWEGSVYGWHLSRPMSGYEIIIIREREDYKDTFEHELYHVFDDLIYTYLGINLDYIFGVEDFDEYVVHAKDPRFTEYDMDDVGRKLRPYLEEAIAIKRGHITKSSYQKILIAARKFLLSLQSTLKEIEPIEKTRKKK